MSSTRPNIGLGSGRDLTKVCAGLALVLAVAVLTLVHYHDRFWYPPDEGNHAYIASRLNAGDVLHRDVQAVHTGYVFFVQAAALRWFGDDLISLRYPVVGLALFGAGAIFFLLWRRSPGLAVVCGATLPALSLVQFLNATPHWYAVFLFVALLLVLDRWPKGAGRWVAAGAILGLIVLFRQLTGALVGIGVVSYLMLEAHHDRSSKAATNPRDRGRDPSTRASKTTSGKTISGTTILGNPILGNPILGNPVLGNPVLGKAILLALMALLVAYLLKSDFAVWLVFGVWPLALLGLALWTVDLGWRNLGRMVLALGAGSFVVSLPLVAYHFANDSWSDWFADTVVSALYLSDFELPAASTYAGLALDAVVHLATYPLVSEKVNAVFWLIALLLPAILGWLAVRETFLRPQSLLPPLPYLAVFFALVSIHLQIPIYLFYSTGLSIAALAWWVAGRAKPRLEIAFGLAVLAFALVALFFHAAQPLSRDLDGILSGVRRPLVRDHDLPRVSLWVEREDVAQYSFLLDLIAREVRPDETLLTLPSNIELNYMSGVRSPVRFFNSALGMPDLETVRETIDVLERAPPRLVFFDPLDKYASPETIALMDWVADHYDLLRRYRSIEIYRSRER